MVDTRADRNSRADQNIDSGGPAREKALAALLAAAGDPLRLRILGYLRNQDRSVREICGAMDAAQPRISHHLAVLRRNGLLRVKVDGRRRLHGWAHPPRNGEAEQLLQLLDRWLSAHSLGKGNHRTRQEEAPVPRAPTGEGTSASEGERKDPSPPVPGDDLEDYLL